MVGRIRLRKRRVLDGLLPDLDTFSTDSSDSSSDSSTINAKDKVRRLRESSEESDTDSTATAEDRFEFDVFEESFDFNEVDDWDDTNGTDWNGSDYRFIAYLNFACTEGMSIGSLRRMDWLMTTLYGQQPPYTSRDVQRELRRTEKSVIMEKIYYCNTCGLQKGAKAAACNVCRSFHLMSTTTLVIVDAQLQLRDLLEKKGTEVLESHAMLHRKLLSAFHQHDIRRTRGYMEMMETEQMFNKKVVHLIITLSSDGARYKRLSKREVTPMLLRVECLPTQDRTGGACFVVLSMAYSDGGVKKHTVDSFITRSLSQLQNLSLDVNIGGELWIFHVKILGFLSDMKEQRSLTGLPNWSQTQGCSKCTTIGSQKTHGITYSDFRTFPHRTDDDYIRWSAAGTHGFSECGIPTVFKFIDPTKFLIDPFHIKGMGVCKGVLSELIRPTKWKTAKMRPGRMDALNDAINSMKSYTYDSVPLRNIGKLGKATGREVGKLALIATGTSAWTLSFQSSEFTVFMIAMYNALFFTGSTIADPQRLRDLMDSLYKVHVYLAPESVTIKFHNFYKHVSEHEDKFGILLTTEPYEREHKQFMVMMNQYSSNSENMLVTRYTIGQMCRRRLEELLPQLSNEKGESMRRTLRSRNTRMTEPMFGESNFLSFDELTPDHMTIIHQMRLPRGVRFRKRMSVTTSLGSFVFCAPDYWKVLNSTQSIICWTRPTDRSFRYGEIEVIWDCNGNQQCAVTEYVLETFHDTFKSIAEDNNLNPIVSDLFDKCLYFPTTFARINSTCSSFISSNQIIAPACVLYHDGYSYVTLYR